MRRKCFHPQAESKPAGGTSTADISDAPLIEAYAQKIVLGRKAMVIAGRASQEHLAPGGEYAEQKAETGCECESHVRVFLAYLMRFPIGISRHANFFSALRVTSFANSLMLSPTRCPASAALRAVEAAALCKVSLAVIISLPFALSKVCDHNLNEARMFLAHGRLCTSRHPI